MPFKIIFWQIIHCSTLCNNLKEKRYSEIKQVTLTFSSHHTLKRAIQQTDFGLVEIDPVVSMYFRNFVIISHLKRAGSFIWTNLNPLYPRMLCAKFGWNWPSCSEEEDENVKSSRQRRRRTADKFWSEKLTRVFSSGELKNH